MALQNSQYSLEYVERQEAEEIDECDYQEELLRAHLLPHVHRRRRRSVLLLLRGRRQLCERERLVRQIPHAPHGAFPRIGVVGIVATAIKEGGFLRRSGGS